jgi:hypothetical protein
MGRKAAYATLPASVLTPISSWYASGTSLKFQRPQPTLPSSHEPVATSAHHGSCEKRW